MRQQQAAFVRCLHLAVRRDADFMMDVGQRHRIHLVAVGVKLAPAGAALSEPARRLLQDVDALPRQAMAAASGLTGRLRLAFVSSVAYGALPQWVQRFRATHPDVQLSLREATYDVQLAAFANDEIDVGFVIHAVGARPPGLQGMRVGMEPLVLALPQQHPLVAQKETRARSAAAAAGTRDRLSFARIADEPLVLFPRNSAPSLFDAVLALYRSKGKTPRVAQEAVQMQTIVNLVSAGMGVAWVPASLMQLQRPGVVYRALRGAPLHCETSMLWRDAQLPVAARFVAHVAASGRA